MRQLIGKIALPVAGVLYPFVVYFGEEKIAPPLFALVLGAIWLIRAPSLLHQPGGRWMLGVALAYCASLAFIGSDMLLRWYPVLINALLLATFGWSLIYGPPFIERFARMQEPDLPPAAVRYTRVVTWVWVGFFAFNGSMAAALTLWAPLSWWTLYNGCIFYVLLGTLFGGEWLLRQRLRRNFV
ncbi:MAG: hypothetical protein ABI114_07200 [Rhodanobacter sp.]